ncbi:MAG: hypothetical protein AAFP69_18590, partial [Planctomycetota bacterium]
RYVSLRPAVLSNASTLSASRQIVVPIRVSVQRESIHNRDVHQLLVSITGIQSPVHIVDYTPKTTLATEVDGTIQVTSSNEKSNNLGFSVDVAAPGIGHGNTGGDVLRKEVQTEKFQRAAPMRAVTAAGTFDRSRGVYFKIRLTRQQVLEGDQTFHLVFSVPSEWRGSLLDISTSVQRRKEALPGAGAIGLDRLPGMEAELVSAGQQRFVVAVVDHRDESMQQLSQRLVHAEQELRQLADLHDDRIQRRRQKNLFLRMANVLDGDKPRAAHSDQWMQRVLYDRFDPLHDPVAANLSADIRVAILNYVQLREQFLPCSVTPADLPSSTPAP